MFAPVLLLFYQRLPADGRLPYREHRQRPLLALLSSLCFYAPFVCFVCLPCLYASFCCASSVSFLNLEPKINAPFTRHLLRHFMERRDRRVGRLDIQRRSDPETDAVSIWRSPLMISAARSPTITQGAMVLPVVTRGMTDPSAMRRFLTPYTLRSPSTADIASRPIFAVDVWCQKLNAVSRM